MMMFVCELDLVPQPKCSGMDKRLERNKVVVDKLWHVEFIMIMNGGYRFVLNLFVSTYGGQ